jgi:hypothetical protein
MSKTSQLKTSKKEVKKTLGVIEGTSKTGEILKSRGLRNALIVVKLATAEFGHVSAAVLLSQDMAESDAIRVLDGWLAETGGKKFAAWLCVNDFKETVTRCNFGLCEEQMQDFLTSLTLNLGLQDFLKLALRNAAAKRVEGDPYGRIVYDAVEASCAKNGADFRKYVS